MDTNESPVFQSDIVSKWTQANKQRAPVEIQDSATLDSEDTLEAVLNTIHFHRNPEIEAVIRNGLRALLDPSLFMFMMMACRSRTMAAAKVAKRKQPRITAQVARFYSNHTFVTVQILQRSRTVFTQRGPVVETRGMSVRSYCSIAQLQAAAVRRRALANKMSRSLTIQRHRTLALLAVNRHWAAEPTAHGGGGRVHIAGPRTGRLIAQAAAAETFLGIGFDESDGRALEVERARSYYKAVGAANGLTEAGYQIALSLMPHSVYRSLTTVDPVFAAVSGSFMMDGIYHGPLSNRQKKASTIEIDVFVAKLLDSSPIEREAILATGKLIRTGELMQSIVNNASMTPAVRFLKCCYGVPIVPMTICGSVSLIIDHARSYHVFETDEGFIHVPNLHSDEVRVTAFMDSAPGISVVIETMKAVNSLRPVIMTVRSTEWRPRAVEAIICQATAYMMPISAWHKWDHRETFGNMPVYSVRMRNRPYGELFAKFRDYFYYQGDVAVIAEAKFHVSNCGELVDVTDLTALPNLRWVRGDRVVADAVSCAVENSRVYAPSGAILFDVQYMKKPALVGKFKNMFRYETHISKVFEKQYAIFFRDLFTTSSVTYEVLLAVKMGLPVSLSTAAVLNALVFAENEDTHRVLQGWATYIIDDLYVDDLLATDERRVADANYCQQHAVLLKILLLPFYNPIKEMMYHIPLLKDSGAICGISIGGAGVPRVSYNNTTGQFTYVYSEGSMVSEVPDVSVPDNLERSVHIATRVAVVSAVIPHSDLVHGLFNRGLLAKCQGPATESDISTLRPGVYEIAGEFYELATAEHMDNTHAQNTIVLQQRFGVSEHEATALYQEYTLRRLEAIANDREPVPFDDFFTADLVDEFVAQMS